MRLRRPAFSQPTRAAMRLTAVLWSFGYLLVAMMMVLQGRSSFFVGVLTNVPLLLVGLLLSSGVYAVHRRGPRAPLLRVGLLVLACAGATVVITFVDAYQLQWLGRTLMPGWRKWSDVTLSRIGGNLILYGWTFALNAALFWALAANEAAREGERRATDAEAAHQGAKLDALRLQLNPHFLFNTLNALSSLVVTGRNQAAEEMIARLSEFLRASLTTDARALIPLGEELATLEAYLEIEAVRFGERLAVEVDCEASLRDAAVPGFILQPLVENAVKYGVAQAKRTVTVRIEAWRNGTELMLAVEDDGPGVVGSGSSRPAGVGVGLRNVRARLDTLYGPQASLAAAPRTEGAGYRAVIRLPFQSLAKSATERRALEPAA